ncbi:Mitochondrial substrate/solute carrier [Dillenia turbinata]|uniref:Mitochondrial substrate/solute carrier n=1 Tax=Dillenia turbinata TaxID=194707 RepID=A0AAN8ZAU3_9MAGN
MAFSDRTRQSLSPSFLYTTSPSLARAVPRIPLPRMMSSNTSLPSDLSPKWLVVPSPSEPERKEMNSSVLCASYSFAGLVTGLIRTTVTPLDLVKCNMQIDPPKYKSILSGFGVVLEEQGMRGFFRGWVPTLLGYSAGNACMLGVYDFLRRNNSELAGPERTMIDLAGSASAVAIGCVVQCPMEAVKVRVQTRPGFARGLSDGFPKFVQSEGVVGCTRDLFLFGDAIFHVSHILSLFKLGFKFCDNSGGQLFRAFAQIH